MRACAHVCLCVPVVLTLGLGNLFPLICNPYLTRKFKELETKKLNSQTV